MSRPASVGIAALGQRRDGSRGMARSDCRIATNGMPAGAGIGLSSTSNWRIDIDCRVMLADHLCEGAVRLDESFEGIQILTNLRFRLLRQALRQTCGA